MTRIALALCWILLASLCRAQTVEPKALQDAKSLELGELVRLLMPDKSATFVGWDHRADSVIQWITDGYKVERLANGQLHHVREGVVRVHVLGKSATVLKKRKLELGWTVRFVNISNPRRGPEQINIAVGPPGEVCFGSTYENCSFDPLKSFAAAGLVVKQICRKAEPGIWITGLQLMHPTRRPTLLRWVYTEGSGGGSTWLTLIVSNDSSTLCASL